jgi:Tfp pilus assembly protein PilX
MSLFKNNQKGFAAFLITILIFTIVFSITVSIFILTYNQQKISRNIIASNQAYYLAEAGVEDALLRMVKRMNWLNSYTINIDEDLTTVEISDVIGGSRTINAEGNVAERIKKVSIVYAVRA